MKKSRFTDSQIIDALKRAEAGVTVTELCRELGISSATFYKWRARFGGMDASLMARMKEQEEEEPATSQNVCRGETQGRGGLGGSHKKVVKPSRRREMAQRAVQQSVVA